VIRLAILALLLTSCGDNTPAPVSVGNSQTWTAGPTINGESYSPQTVINGNIVTIPAAPGHANYITQPCNLNGKSKMTLRYTFDGTATPKSDPAAPSIISLYFQKKRDDWQTDGLRWYSAFVMQTPITVGSHEIVAPLDGAWSSVMTMTAASNPTEFAAAKNDTDVCGFVLGGGTGLGHGVYGPATVTIDEFTIN
jgi:hypothetical protein